MLSKIRVLWILNLTLVFSGCVGSSFEKHGDAIILHLQKSNNTDPKLMKLQVCSDDIIHIIAAPGEEFSSRPSLIVNKTRWEPVSWTVREEGNEIIITTAKLTVRVDSITGALAFFDSEGKLLLEEKSDGGKLITETKVMDEGTYHVRQLFESPSEEAFYGLGQHQNNVMNYKGHDIRLSQHNIVASNPFLVSNKNYGILWDNNSLTKFGDVREYQPITTLALIDNFGNPGGLTAEYFNSSDFQLPVTSKTESRIEHRFIDVNDPYPDKFNQNRGSIRWTGKIECRESGIHKLQLFSSGYTRMWLNGELVVDAWRQNWLPWTHNFQIPMERGKRYPVKIEWIPEGGFIGLSALPPDPSQDPKALSLYSEVGDQIDYYFIRGDNLDQVVRGYREITGKVPMMPKWALGLWQCRERYRTQEDLLSVVREYRRRRIPLDNIVQDWFYWEEDRWGSHEFDRSRYPDPEGMVKELHEKLNTRIMISVWPKFYVGTKHYDEFKKQDLLYMRNVEKNQRDWVGRGYVSTFYDPYTQGARDLFWEQINQKLFSMDMDAWWMDATEPDIQSNLSEEERRLRMHPTAKGTAGRYLNTYSLEQSRAVYEGQIRQKPDQRVFILTRSAYAGQQRYGSATWSGDIAARWEDLRNQIPAGLNFSIAGIPYWTTDIGGFAVEQRYIDAKGEDLEEWRELMTRWFQFGTFCPLLRIHGQYPYREIYNVAPEHHPAYKAMTAYNELRYRLMPYIYSLAGMVTHDDYTIMRAMVMDFSDDPEVLDIGHQFMFGPALLVSPVTEYKARSADVYLPESNGWYDIREGRYFEGGQKIKADAPYSDIPVFVREGSIVPFGPPIQYSTEKAADPVRLRVYTGQNGFFTLYEDENINNNYQNGAFSWIPLTYNESDHTLTIGTRRGEFPGMLHQRTFEVVWIGHENPVSLDLEAAPATVILYNGKEVTVGITE
jgi:alpha-D-xyloside xylohydrolase